MEFRPALKPWLDYRAKQGHRFLLIDNRQTPLNLRKSIRDIARSGKLKTVVIVGDAAPTAGESGDVSSRLTPAPLLKAKVNIHFGSEPTIATDNWYADLDDDYLPDLMIGRLPADTPAELSEMIRKIIAYESAPPANWQRRINFIAGVGGFGSLVDSVLENATKKFMVDGVPASYSTSMTYGSWRSPYCPDPREFHDVALNRLNEGCLFWVYIGHGARTYLDEVRTPGGRYPILSTLDKPRMKSAEGLPIAIFLACYSGAFDHTDDCLAEEMVKSPSGPVAVISATRVTMPYAMTVMANGMLQEYFVNRHHLLGDVFRRAKRQLLTMDAADDNRVLIDMVAKVISPKPELLEEERREHLSLYNLLGDPLLRLPLPERIEMKATDSIEAGKTLEVSGEIPHAGKCVIEFVCRRDRATTRTSSRSVYRHEEISSYNATYAKANKRVFSRHETIVKPGPFQFSLPIPVDVRGPCHVRLMVLGDKASALGSSDVFVSRPRKSDNE